MEAPKFQKRSYYKHLISNVSSDRKTPKLFLNGPSPASFIIYFRSFQTNITIFTTIYVKNVHPVSGAGIQIPNLLDVSLLP